MPDPGPPLIQYDYGFQSRIRYDRLELELTLFRLNWQQNAAFHFMQAANFLWPEDAKGDVRPFVWHPWAQKMLEYACKHDYLAILGSGSSGKSQFGAIWAIINFLCAPRLTMVLVTSTSLPDSRKRIWGDIKNFITYSTVGDALPCKLVDSRGLLLADAGNGNFSDKEGIALIAGAPGKERDAIGKMIGIKAARVILIADELPELSPAILEASSNLSTQIDQGAQKARFQIVALGNFKSVYDPMGEFAEPIGGYDTINVGMDDWQTKRGWCLHFDGLRSPNVLAGVDRWPIYGNKQLAEHKRAWPENSAQFWRMCRSFPCPEGSENNIYSDAAFLQGEAHKAILWAYPPVNFAFMDPSFTNGGDRTTVVLGQCGDSTTGVQTVQFTKVELLFENVTMKDRTRNFQIAEKFRDICVANRVQPEHAGMDATAAGAVLYDVVCELWSRKVVPICFGGNASELPVNTSDTKPASDHYCNRVSELWYVGVDLLAGGQLKGITNDMAREMKARLYETVKAGAFMKVKVETKTDMKLRVGFSPDWADAAFGLIDLCRQTVGLVANPKRAHIREIKRTAGEEARAAAEVYQDIDYGEQHPEDLYADHLAA